MLNHKGEVAECTGDNIFVVHGDKIHTPSIDSGILEGITRNAVIELARAAGHTVIERTMDRHDVLQRRRVLPDRDRRRADPGRRMRRARARHRAARDRLTRELRQRFQSLVREER